MAYIQVSGNCNFSYVTGLNGETAEDSMRSILTTPPNYYAPKAARDFYKPSCGMFLFAQGSDHSVKNNPYAPNFKRYIEEHGLGTVYEMPPVPNPLHGGSPGILFVWIINHAACAEWWKKHGNVK